MGERETQQLCVPARPVLGLFEDNRVASEVEIDRAGLARPDGDNPIKGDRLAVANGFRFDVVVIDLAGLESRADEHAGVAGRGRHVAVDADGSIFGAGHDDRGVGRVEHALLLAGRRSGRLRDNHHAAHAAHAAAAHLHSTAATSLLHAHATATHLHSTAATGLLHATAATALLHATTATR